MDLEEGVHHLLDLLAIVVHHVKEAVDHAGRGDLLALDRLAEELGLLDPGERLERPLRDLDVAVAQRRTTSVQAPTWMRAWRSWCVHASAPSGDRTNAV